MVGQGGQIRTGDPLLPNRVRYQELQQETLWEHLLGVQLESLRGLHRLKIDYIGSAEEPDALGEIAASG